MSRGVVGRAAKAAPPLGALPAEGLDIPVCGMVWGSWSSYFGGIGVSFAGAEDELSSSTENRLFAGSAVDTMNPASALAAMVK